MTITLLQEQEAGGSLTLAVGTEQQLAASLTISHPPHYHTSLIILPVQGVCLVSTVQGVCIVSAVQGLTITPR